MWTTNESGEVFWDGLCRCTVKVLTVGSFDLYHRGHAFLLHECRKLAGPDGKVIVGVNTSEFVKSFKGHEPIQTFDERRDALASVKYVDDIIPNNDVSLKAMISAMAPDYLVIGQDWAVKNYYAQIGLSQKWLNERHVSLIYIPREDPLISTTDLKSRIRRHVGN